MLVKRFIATYKEKYKDDFHQLYKIETVHRKNSLGELVVESSNNIPFNARIMTNLIKDGKLVGFLDQELTFLYIGRDLIFTPRDTVVFNNDNYDITSVDEKFAIQGTSVLFEIKARKAIQ